MRLRKQYKRIVKPLMLSVACLMMLGCSTTVPVKIQFPEAPSELMTPATNLKQLSDNEKSLSNLLENANDNYSQYYLLKEKYEAWQQWYKEQKEVFEITFK